MENMESSQNKTVKEIADETSKHIFESLINNENSDGLDCFRVLVRVISLVVATVVIENYNDYGVDAEKKKIQMAKEYIDVLTMKTIKKTIELIINNEG